MNVPILRRQFSEDDRRFLHRGWQEVLDSGTLTRGKWAERFEALFAELVGARYAVATSSGTAALELIIRALGIEAASIVVPTNTFIATAFAVARTGNQVVFADADPRTLCLDAETVRRSLRPDTRAVVLVHIGGMITPAVEDLRRLCAERGLHLIEDAAHAHGSRWGQRSAGTFGVAAAFSFFPTKVLTTGEGGMVTTDDGRLQARMLSLRNHGKSADDAAVISELGVNWHLSEFTAVLGVQQLERAAEILAERRGLAAAYEALLAGVRGARALRIGPESAPNYYKFVVELDADHDRDRIKRLMRTKYGVGLTGEVYAELCHRAPVWLTYTRCGRLRTPAGVACTRWPACGCDDGAGAAFPGSEYLCRHHVCLPVYPGLQKAEVEHVVRSLDLALRDGG